MVILRVQTESETRFQQKKILRKIQKWSQRVI